MKAAVFALALMILGGCANFDPEAMQRFAASYNQMEQQRAQNYNAAFAANSAQMQQQAAQRPAMTLAGSLTNQRVSGTLKYCTYSNGVVTTVGSIDFCPMNN